MADFEMVVLPIDPQHSNTSLYADVRTAATTKTVVLIHWWYPLFRFDQDQLITLQSHLFLRHHK